MYPSFQGYIRFVTLLFPLNHPHKVIHMYVHYSETKIVCNYYICADGAVFILSHTVAYTTCIAIRSLYESNISGIGTAFNTTLILISPHVIKYIWLHKLNY